MASLNLIRRGYTFERTITYYQPSRNNPEEKGDPLDLTGIIITWNLVTETSSLAYTNGNGLTIDFAAGQIVISLTPAVTTTLPEGFATSYFDFAYPDGVLARQLESLESIIT